MLKFWGQQLWNCHFGSACASCGSTAGGEIFQQRVAEEDEAFTKKDVVRLLRQILSGVAFLHHHGVAHLNPKPQNILQTHSSPPADIHIVDFGLSRRVDAVQEVREILGTPEYVAPEVLSYEPITDTWKGASAHPDPAGEHRGRLRPPWALG